LENGWRKERSWVWWCMPVIPMLLERWR
jgi:hypothetical protein